MSAASIVRVTTLSSGQEFSWRRAAADDAPLLWSWWTAAHARFWSVDRRLAGVCDPPYGEESVRRYLGAASSAVGRTRKTVEPLIGSLSDQEPMVYAELYWKLGSPLADNPILDDGARGMHMLVGKVKEHPKWMVLELTADALEWQFSQYSSMTQAVADPDVRNVAMHILCQRLGMRELGVVDLPGKRTRVMAIDRAEWMERGRERYNWIAGGPWLSSHGHAQRQGNEQKESD